MYACRESGDRRWLGLPEEKIRALIEDASAFTKEETVGKRQVLKAIAAMDFRINFLAESELRDHRDRQILISTQGAVVGQINGLSVIETAGTSYEFGEPVRITATARAGGEGDVIDIERKAELAGQIHAKAMMIINGYLTKEFGSDQPLPMSASLVFEQSYSEVDGDSASLTGLCAVISCLAKVPIRQDLAVTGAVDQFGDVQPVGGVNEKIEGLKEIYDYEYDFKENFGLNSEDIEFYTIAMNEDNMDMFLFIQPLEDKKNDVKLALDNYFSKLEKNENQEIANKAKNKSYTQIGSYLVYIMTDNSSDILNSIKDSKENIFGALMEVNDETLESQFNINKSDVKEYLIKVPMMITSSNSYIIIKPVDGKKDEVKEKIDEYMTKLEKQWETYLPEQYELVKNRLEKEYGDYLIYIVSSNNDLVFETIKANNLS